MAYSFKNPLDCKSLRSYRDLGRVIAGTASGNILRGAFKLMVAGFLGPAAIGILRSIYALFLLLSSLAALGLDYATVIFLARIIRDQNEPEKKRLLQTVLCLKIYATVFLLLVGNLFAEQISLRVLSDADLTPYFRLVLLAVGGQLFWRYISSYLSAHQYFDRLSYFLVTMPVLMWIMGIALILLELFDLRAAILIYLFAPMVAALVWWPLFHRENRIYPGLSNQWLSRLLKFSPWVYLSHLFSSTRRNVSILLLKNATLSGSQSVGETQAGLYSFGQDLAEEITIVSQALFTVLLPKVSGYSDIAQLKGLLLKTYRHMVLLLLPLALLSLLFEPFILALAYFFPSYLDFLSAVPICIALYAGALLALACTPMTAALYALKHPHIETCIEMVSVCLLVTGSILLIPGYGYMGAAIMVVVQRAATLMLLIFSGVYVLNKTEREAR